MTVMERMQALIRWYNHIRIADFIAPLLLRIYLVPVFWMAGTMKLASFPDTVEWFGNAEWGLGLPYPYVMAFLATWTEILGAVALAVGVGVRFMTVPLMVTMLVAMFSVHWTNGWLAIADSTSMATVNLREALDALETSDPDLYRKMTANGRPVILNNGIEFAATYFIMLLTLFFTGAGRFLSVDYWICRRVCPDVA